MIFLTFKNNGSSICSKLFKLLVEDQITKCLLTIIAFCQVFWILCNKFHQNAKTFEQKCHIFRKFTPLSTHFSHFDSLSKCHHSKFELLFHRFCTSKPQLSTTNISTHQINWAVFQAAVVMHFMLSWHWFHKYSWPRFQTINAANVPNRLLVWKVYFFASNRETTEKMLLEQMAGRCI